ncbi:MAG: hypothetical protein HUU47_07355 [Bacteroidetes bacterium]|nr:hypothetical protein [Bacteroidota bacterium]
MKVEDSNNQQPETEKPIKITSNFGNIFAGMIVIIAGALILLKNIGTPLPTWIFTWPMLLIGIGIFLGARHSFRHGGWWIFCVVGSVFLFKDFINNLSISNIIWPLLIIFFGLIIMLKPRRRNCNERFHEHWKTNKTGHYNGIFNEKIVSDEDFVESTSIFGGVKKNIISKNFKGGDILCIFGGTEINLMQADFEGQSIIQITQVFGGTKLIVPAHWNVVTETVAILGGIEDKRHNVIENSDSNKKVLILKGTSIFAGIDIRSY